MNEETRIDAHCHFFNIEYLILELLAILADDILHGYPSAHTPGGSPDPAFPPNPETGIGEIIAWFTELVDALFSAPDEHFLALMHEFRKGIGFAGDAAAFPLMMDIFYMFRGKPLPGAGHVRHRFDHVRFKTQVETVRNFVMHKLDRKMSGTAAHDAHPLARHRKRIEQCFEKHTRAIRRSRIGRNYFGQIFHYLCKIFRGDIELSPGFRMHAKELIRLEARRRGNVFPFFAIDPRRRGVMTMIRTGKPFFLRKRQLVSHDGPFYGLKFYTRLGFRPDDASDPHHDTLLEALDFCIAHQLPAVNHSGPGGFPPEAIFPKWPWEEYSNPVYWDNVMKNGRRDLRINLAHFGYISEEWRNTIVRMLHEYPNVFTDIACFTDRSALEAVKRVWDDDPRVRDRLMLGTDYDVVLVVDPGHGLPDYYTQLRSVFSDDDLKKMSIDNPQRFLRLT